MEFSVIFFTSFKIHKSKILSKIPLIFCGLPSTLYSILNQIPGISLHVILIHGLCCCPTILGLFGEAGTYPLK